MRLYQDEVWAFWRDHPGEKVKLDGAGDGAALAAVGVPERGRAVDGRRVDTLRSVAEPALHDPALPARDRRPLLRAAPRSSCSRSVFVGYETFAAWVFAGTTRYRVPGTSCSRCSRRRRSPGCRSARSPRGAAVAPAVEPEAVDLLGPLGAAVLREALDRADARPRRPIASAPSGSFASRSIASASASASPRRDEQTRLALADEVLEPADRGGDHRPRALHRLERDHPEALAERRHDDARATPRSRAGRASRGRGSAPRRSSPSSRARSFRPCSSTPRPGDVEPRVGPLVEHAAERAQQHDVPLDRDQAADAEEARRARRRTARGSGPAAIP